MFSYYYYFAWRVTVCIESRCGTKSYMDFAGKKMVFDTGKPICRDLVPPQAARSDGLGAPRRSSATEALKGIDESTWQVLFMGYSCWLCSN